MRGVGRLLIIATAIALAAGCGAAPVDPAQLLRDAKQSAKNHS